jgi:hypothetical protein
MSNLTEFFEDSIVEIERRNRIKLSLAAYVYEFHSNQIMSDAEFDSLSLKIDTSISTDNAIMDKFFTEEFSPYTGQWIHDHPDKQGLELIYKSFYLKELTHIQYYRLKYQKRLSEQLESLQYHEN